MDFLSVTDNKLEYMLEVKTSDDQFSPSLRYFSERLKVKESIQLVHKLLKSTTSKHGSVQKAALWLAGLEI
ncbi:MAG: hypothetical protein NTV34_12875 [Proteobacteria bacterium]|nr:hypothetical protein [Pseudomonadota bacterium]